MPRRPRTLRTTVLLALLGGVLPVLLLLGGGLFAAVQREVWTRVDERLVQSAHQVASLVEHHHGHFEYELGHDPPALVSTPGQRTEFMVLTEDHELVARSSEGLQWPRDVRWGKPTSAVLPSGADVRLLLTRAPIFSHGPSQEVLVLVTTERAATVQLLRSMAYWFIAIGVLTLVASTVAVTWAVRVGLRPVDDVAQTLAEVRPETLDTRVDATGLPLELRMIADSANALLDGLQSAFEHERRYSGDVAHELRTPLAALKAELQVALRRERDPQAYREVLRRADASCDRLVSLVGRLLELARHDSAARVPVAPVALRPYVEASLRAHEAQVLARGLTVRNEIPQDATVTAEAHLLGSIVSNLVDNAVDYTERGGWIAVRLVDGGLEVADSGPVPTDAQRRDMFRRFWRASEARETSEAHAGLGLAIVTAAAARLGWTVDTTTHDGFAVRLRWS